MPRTRISFASCNLYNLNLHGLGMYRDRNGWSQEEYSKKLRWTSQKINEVGADVWGFQELWHQDALQEVFAQSNHANDYTLLIPENHTGQRIVCAGAVRSSILHGDPEWIDDFPDIFRLSSRGDDPQTPDIGVNIDRFSRPVLYFTVRPRSNGRLIHVYVCHFKSKGPTTLSSSEYPGNTYSIHRTALGSAISTIRRTAEATALRMILNERMTGSGTQVVVLGDLNDGQHSNTLNILTAQPNYLYAGQSGGGDRALYSAGTLQEYRSLRDVYYTHVYKNTRESLDHILVSEEFYDNSTDRVWTFEGMNIINDHLNNEEHKEDGSTDHGIVSAEFEYRPA